MNDNVRKSVYSKWKRVFCVSCVFHRAHMAFPNFLSLQQEVRKAAGSLGANFFVSQGESLAADVSNDAQPDAARTSKLTLLFLYRPAVLCVVLCEHSLTWVGRSELRMLQLLFCLLSLCGFGAFQTAALWGLRARVRIYVYVFPSWIMWYLSISCWNAALCAINLLRVWRAVAMCCYLAFLCFCCVYASGFVFV